MASIYQRSKGGVWYISYRQDGRQRHRSLGTKNPREARRLLKEIEFRLESAPETEFFISERPKSEIVNPTVDEFWQAFSTWAMEHRSRSAVDEYRTWFKRFTEFAALERVGDAKRTDVERFKVSLMAQGIRTPKGVGLAPTSVNGAIKALRSIWNHGAKLGLHTGDNPFRLVERFPVAQRSNHEFLEREAVDALLNAAATHAKEPYVHAPEAKNVQLAIALMALAGLRKREACFALWEWVQWDRKVLIVSSHDGFTTKNRKSRVVSMHDDLVKILWPHRKENGYILESVRVNELKSRYRVDFRKSFQRVCEIAGIKTTPHGLRHSFASRHAVAGTPLHVIAGWLGHSSTTVTERYAHFQTGYNKAANNI